jgi:hypothetical protein
MCMGINIDTKLIWDVTMSIHYQKKNLTSEERLSVMNQPYNCIYCDRYFHFKDLFDRHRPTCEYFYRSKRERIHSMEAIEALPSQQDLFRLVQHLTNTVRQLEGDMVKLKDQVNIRVKKSILHKLSQQGPPTCDFFVWIKTFPVKIQHLEEVFQPLNGLIDGIKLCVSDRIASEGILNVPIRSYQEKPGILYIYSIDPVDGAKWRACPGEAWPRLMDAIAHEFTRAFCVWEDQHSAAIHADKDRHIIYLVKITGPQAVKERQKQTFKSWLIDMAKGTLS